MPVPQVSASRALQSLSSWAGRAERVVLGAALVLAVSWPSSAVAETPHTMLKPCPVVLEGVDMTDWQFVEAKGFTFCVPPTWNVSGSRARFAGGSVQWKNGRPPRPDAAFRVGDRVSPDAMVSAAPRTTFEEIVGGEQAEFWRQSLRGSFKTGATWNSPGMYFTGDANSEELAGVQFAVYRTVRFTT